MIAKVQPLIHAVWGWIYGIHPTVWASFIAFGGASYSIREAGKTATLQRKEASKLAEQQRQHDAEQRNRDRTMALRRDVFLCGADGVALADRTIGELADLSVEDSRLADARTEVVAALARMRMIGGPVTTQAVGKLVMDFEITYSELFITRGKVKLHKNGNLLDGTRALETFVENAIKRREAFVAALEPVLLAVRAELEIPTDPEQFAKLRRQGIL